ncbi:hypothetical protein C8J57DRAFT_1228013 [Mycena rebaudengoi]|nr:hypothetical protein C8J57DRAFT_1238786 [Mycena rebaudengoi]KAJ7254431.1 hypothetical protein C8J57DRAFT_1236674 [Mycena rebaudengoi]KAJ7266011.1 hypothetical protein C8J57DRAFT_1229421 [Mycena rebaudengoi]KAJ7268299.1 hypothetical protein C8J57DRAFT_1228013 [Mycena rebaudengoi]
MALCLHPTAASLTLLSSARLQRVAVFVISPALALGRRGPLMPLMLTLPVRQDMLVCILYPDSTTTHTPQPDGIAQPISSRRRASFLGRIHLEPHHYNAMRAFHHAQGFDPCTQEVTRHLGLPLLADSEHHEILSPDKVRHGLFALHLFIG